MQILLSQARNCVFLFCLLSFYLLRNINCHNLLVGLLQDIVTNKLVDLAAGYCHEQVCWPCCGILSRTSLLTWLWNNVTSKLCWPCCGILQGRSLLACCRILSRTSLLTYLWHTATKRFIDLLRNTVTSTFCWPCCGILPGKRLLARFGILSQTRFWPTVEYTPNCHDRVSRTGVE